MRTLTINNGRTRCTVDYDYADGLVSVRGVHLDGMDVVDDLTFPDLERVIRAILESEAVLVKKSDFYA